MSSNIALFVLSFAALASLGYEKTCVLFNVAALASQIASEQNLDNDEGLKVAAKYYQVSTYSFTLESLPPDITVRRLVFCFFAITSWRRNARWLLWCIN